MKKLSLFLVLLLFVSMVKAQDKIIMLNGDTISCKILSVGGERISYEQENTDGYAIGKSIEVAQVKEYVRTSQPIIFPMTATGISRSRSSKPKQPWSIGISSGVSHLPWLFDNMSSYKIPDYYKNAKTGFHVNVGTHYMISNFFGAGAEYSFFKSSYDGISQVIFDFRYPTYINSSESLEQYINYVGASVIFQQHIGKERKIQISETLSGGGLFYRAEEQATMFIPSYSGHLTPIYNQVTTNQLITGFTWAGKVGLSVDYKVLPYLSVGIGGNLFLTWLKEVDAEAKNSDGEHESVKDVELEKSLNLSRIDGSLIFRFHF